MRKNILLAVIGWLGLAATALALTLSGSAPISFGGREMVLPPVSGPLVLRAAAVSTGTGTYVNGSFSDAAIFAENWIATNTTVSLAGTPNVSSSPGSLLLHGISYSQPLAPASVYLKNPPAANFDVSVKITRASSWKTQGLYAMAQLGCIASSETGITSGWSIFGDQTDSICSRTKLNGSWVVNTQKTPGATYNSIYIRLVRVNNVYSSFYKTASPGAWLQLTGGTLASATYDVSPSVFSLGVHQSNHADFYFSELVFASGAPSGQY